MTGDSTSNAPAADPSSATPNFSGHPWFLPVSLLVALIALVFVFYDGLEFMVKRWESDEYSHGYMIPLVALFMLWQRLPRLADVTVKPAWLGLLLMLVALAGGALGELSSLYTIIQYSFLLAIYALAISILGWRGSWVIWAPLAYLIFMIPLPSFLYNNLSQQLQLISSELGVWVIRLFGVSVFLEGNVIDLGTYQLQVVEACSGLRYLFPLMSFGFLIAYLYQGPRWHKWVIFLSTLPITVLMNSFRIGVIGVTVKHWGTEAAEGFLHDFEGWVVFMACLGLLGLEIWLLNLFSRNRQSISELINLDYPTPAELKSALPASLSRINPVLIASVVLILVAIPLGHSLNDRVEVVPERDPFARFPLLQGEWMGQESAIEAPVLDALKLSDYIKADYRRGSHELPVNFYIAYYESQRKGSSIHSPRSCIPGGGWVIASLTQLPMDSVSGAEDLTVNRLVIQKENVRQLVYYWFDQRGRVITNEYLAKWYLFWDSLTQHRTDGALVRLTTPVPENTDINDADQRLRDFIKDFYPLLPDYIPQ